MNWNIVFAIAGFAVFGGLVMAALVRNKTDSATTSTSVITSWFMKNLRVILSIVIGTLLIAFVVWGLSGMQGTFSEFLKSPSLKTVWAFTKEYWLSILIACGLVYASLYFAPKEKAGLADKLQSCIMLILFLLFIGFPVVGWFVGLGGDQKHQQNATVSQMQSKCPDVTSTATRTCHITTDWSNWIRLADGARNNGMKICHSLGVESERTDNGATMLRFRITSGETDIKYRLYPLDTECSIEGF